MRLGTEAQGESLHPSSPPVKWLKCFFEGKGLHEQGGWRGLPWVRQPAPGKAASSRIAKKETVQGWESQFKSFGKGKRKWWLG